VLNIFGLIQFMIEVESTNKKMATTPKMLVTKSEMVRLSIDEMSPFLAKSLSEIMLTDLACFLLKSLDVGKDVQKKAENQQCYQLPVRFVESTFKL
jgi:hypothetical protein